MSKDFLAINKPEARLHIPARGFVQRVIPGRNVLLQVTAESGQIEVEPGLFRESDQLAESGEVFLIELLGGLDRKSVV